MSFRIALSLLLALAVLSAVSLGACALFAAPQRPPPPAGPVVPPAAPASDVPVYDGSGNLNSTAIPGLVLPGIFETDWWLDNTDTPGDDLSVLPVWYSGDFGAGVSIADIDSGIDPRGLNVTVAPGGQNFMPGEDPADTYDGYGHGSAVASILAGSGGAPDSFIGVAPRASVLPLRIYDDAGASPALSISLAAIAYAGAHGDRIANVELVSPGPIFDADQMSAFAAYPNTLFVTPAGNAGTDNDTSAWWPCNLSAEPNVICVGASTSTDQFAAFSQWGPASVSLLAPGAFIGFDWPAPGGAAQASLGDGTSCSAAMVSGAAALMLAANPTLTAAQMKAILLATVRPEPGLRVVTLSGGVLDISAAVAGARALPGALPLPTPTPTPTPTPKPPHPQPAPPGKKAPAKTPASPPAPRLSRVKLTGSGARRTLSFTLSAPARVKVSVSARACAHGRCAWRVVLTRAEKARKGTDRIAITRLPGGRLRANVRVTGA